MKQILGLELNIAQVGFDRGRYGPWVLQSTADDVSLAFLGRQDRMDALPCGYDEQFAMVKMMTHL